VVADREALARDLVAASYLKGDFVLRSGKRSHRYFDKFLFELGAVLLGGAVSMETGLPLVLVRKEPKGYGTAKQLEGRFEPGERVTVIEDVVTTGGDSLRSIEALTNAGLDVIHLVVVLDRGEGGEDNIREARIPYSPLFRIQDLELD
jgi:orotate phosphoribosyltransferase